LNKEYVQWCIVAVVFIIFCSGAWFFIGDGRCQGERRSDVITGNLDELFIECDVCCHVQSGLKVDGVWYQILNCEKVLEGLPLNQSYTFYLEPMSEEFAVSRGCFWSQYLYKVVDGDGVVLWSDGRWF